MAYQQALADVELFGLKMDDDRLGEHRRDCPRRFPPRT